MKSKKEILKMSKKGKWRTTKILYLCKCGQCFWKREHFLEHLKDTKRWRKYHYAPDYSEVPHTVRLCTKTLFD